MPARYFFDDARGGFANFRKACRSRSPVAIFLDYDGTVVPMHGDPAKALLPASTRALLETLAAKQNLFLAFVTGRALRDIREKVGIRKIGYAGTHGLEIQVDGKRWVHPECAGLPPRVKKLVAHLRGEVRRIPGVFFEDKRFCISVHYRQVQNGRVPEIRRKVRASLKAHEGKLRLGSGKKHFEIRPEISWGKGEAVAKMVELRKFKFPPFVVFVGDDRTDEDAFEALKENGLTLRVGRSAKTGAQFYLKNINEVLSLLRWCADGTN